MGGGWFKNTIEESIDERKIELSWVVKNFKVNHSRVFKHLSDHLLWLVEGWKQLIMGLPFNSTYYYSPFAPGTTYTYQTMWLGDLSCGISFYKYLELTLWRCSPTKNRQKRHKDDLSVSIILSVSMSAVCCPKWMGIEATTHQKFWAPPAYFTYLKISSGISLVCFILLLKFGNNMTIL